MMNIIVTVKVKLHQHTCHIFYSLIVLIVTGFWIIVWKKVYIIFSSSENNCRKSASLFLKSHPNSCLCWSSKADHSGDSVTPLKAGQLPLKKWRRLSILWQATILSSLFSGVHPDSLNGLSMRRFTYH